MGAPLPSLRGLHGSLWPESPPSHSPFPFPAPCRPSTVVPTPRHWNLFPARDHRIQAAKTPRHRTYSLHSVGVIVCVKQSWDNLTFGVILALQVSEFGAFGNQAALPVLFLITSPQYTFMPQPPAPGNLHGLLLEVCLQGVAVHRGAKEGSQAWRAPALGSP